jgi:imidazolonepropionase
MISSLMNGRRRMDLLFLNAGPLAHLAPVGQTGALAGHALTDREALTYDAGKGILIRGDVIAKIADSDDLQEEFAPGVKLAGAAPNRLDGAPTPNSKPLEVWDLAGKAVIPGLIDAHTHLLWSGDRSNEVALRQKGLSYREIAEMGGGIGKTVSATRRSTMEELVSEGSRRIQVAMRNGTTFLEAKSGYGLSTESELRLLSAAAELGKNTPIKLAHTWLGAHATPPGGERTSYVDEILTEQLPAVLEQGIATSADVFCEEGWFTLEETELICRAAGAGGLDIRLHVDEFADCGGAGLAAELGAVTADHAAHSSDADRQACHDSGTLQGFLPGTPYVLGLDHWPPFQKCIDEGWAWSLASDFNPNCHSLSLPFAASLAVHRCGVHPLAALVGCSRNAGVGLSHPAGRPLGTLEVGGPASLNILWGEELDGWCLTPGQSPFLATLCEGAPLNWWN